MCWKQIPGQRPDTVVRERLGHAFISETLDTYSHAITGLQEAAAMKSDELLAPTNEVDSNVGK